MYIRSRKFRADILGLKSETVSVEPVLFWCCSIIRGTMWQFVISVLYYLLIYLNYSTPIQVQYLSTEYAVHEHSARCTVFRDIVPLI